MNDPNLALFYLCRKEDGLNPIESFIQSYIQHPAGVKHELIIILKGYEQDRTIKNMFAKLPSKFISVDDSGFDLGSYFFAAEQVTNKYICFLNSYSEILENNWLNFFYEQISLPQVGIVGATGSYESLWHSMTIIQKALWMYSQKNLDIKIKKKLLNNFKFLLKPNQQILDRIMLFFSLLRKSKTKNNSLEKEYKLWWEKEQVREEFSILRNFPSFPNPHIRTNAFMIERDRFLSLKREPFLSKFDAWFFESGHNGMTQQILNMGLSARIIGKNSKGYDIDQWPNSETFRKGEQSNLLIHDNQTKYFLNKKEDEKYFQVFTTWGIGISPI